MVVTKQAIDEVIEKEEGVKISDIDPQRLKVLRGVIREELEQFMKEREEKNRPPKSNVEKLWDWLTSDEEREDDSEES